MRLLAVLIVSIPLANAAPPPGHPSVGDAERILGIPTETDNRYEGQVVEAQNSNNYTYIQVRTAKGMLWIAAPRVDLVPGQRIRFGLGRVLSDFFSRKHQRLFKQIMFVGPVDILPEAL